MKRFILALAALLTITVSVSAMSYEQARDQALFLTDKMAYELNLTDEQYEAAYEINLDYLMRIGSYDDLYGAYWRQRNLDLSYILLDWQYRAYCDAAYFYRPLYWDGGYWHFSIYARYPHRDYFFFGCPDFVWSYRGGHSWYMNGGRSWYYGRTWVGPRDHGPHPGMRVRFDEGRFGQGYRYEPGNRTWAAGSRNGNMRPVGNGSVGDRSFGNLSRSGQNDSPLRNGSFGSQSSTPQSNGNRSFGAPRQSSTRTTVTRPESGSSTFGNRVSSGSSTPSRTFTPQGSGSRSFGNRGAGSGQSSTPSRSFSAPSRSTVQSAPSRSFGGGSSSGSFGGGSSSGSFGGHSSSGSMGGGHSGGTSGGGQFGRR